MLLTTRSGPGRRPRFARALEHALIVHGTRMSANPATIINPSRASPAHVCSLCPLPPPAVHYFPEKRFNFLENRQKMHEVTALLFFFFGD